MKKTLVFLLIAALVVSLEPVGLVRSTGNTEKNIGTCAKFTSDKESCLECVSHYHLFEGQCYIDIHGCSQYVFGNICRKCQSGFILVNNECCDKHCMSRIFKNYEAANEQSELSQQQKVERKITEGYEKTVESLTIFRYQFVKFALVSTSNQVLLGYVRYFIKIIANDKPYRCIADFEMDTKKVFVLEFRLESEMSSIKQNILSQQDVVSNDEARMALQFASGKFGLRTYGSSLERVSTTSYKYGSQFKLIYLGTESAMIIHVVVPSGGNKKQPAYSPWSEQRKDVQAIKTFVQKSMTVVKMKNTPDLQIIKQRVSESSNIKTTEVEMKTIEKVKENVYKYTFVNQQTKQTFEEVSRIDPKTKKVEIVEHKQVISKDIKNMKLPESPEKKIIPKQEVPQTPEVKVAIKYLEEVQPSLATKQITNAAVETIGENKKITLIQKKNDQVSRVVILQNERTNEIKLVDESPVMTTPPTETVYTTSPEGKPKIITNDVEKFKKIDDQVDKVIQTIETKLPSINTTNIQSFQKTEGNMVNTYQIVVKQQKPEQPKQQITVVQNTQTKQVKIIDVGQIPTPAIIEPVKRQPTPIPETEYKAPEVKSIIEQFKKTNPELKDTNVVIKKAEVEQTKFVNQYTVVVETKNGQTLTIKANKPHQQKQPEIMSVKPVYQKPTEKPVEQTYISKVTVNEVTGVKTTTTTKREDIQTSYVTKVLSEVKKTRVEPKVEQIQSVVRKQLEKTVVETVVIKEDNSFVQVTVEQDKKTGTVKKVSEEVVKIQTEQSKPVLPVFSTTQISSTTFNQIVKVNPVLQTVTQTVVQERPTLKSETPVTTEVEQRGPVQVITFVYENKATNVKQRIVTEYNEQTKKTVIKEQTPLPKIIEKVTFEKDITPEGEVKIVSNKIEQVKKEDVHVTNVFKEVSEKIPIVKDNTVRFEVVSNDMTNTYQLTAVEPKTKETVTVSVSYNKETQKVTVNDIQQSPKPESVVPKPVAKPVVVLAPEEVSKPEVKNVVKFVENVVKVSQIKQIKQVKNTLTTSYEVVTQTPQGIKTVVVVTDKQNPSQVTLIDVKSQSPAPSTSTSTSPVTTPTPLRPSYTTMSVDSANVRDTTTNDNTLIRTNRYLKIVSDEAVNRQPLLKDQTVTCFSEDTFAETVYISYIATVGSKKVTVSAFVWVQSSKVQFVELPTQGTDGLNPSAIEECSQRQSTLTTVTKDTITTLSQTSSETKTLVDYVNSQFSPDSIDKLIVEKYPTSIKYVIIVTIKRTVQRIVLVYTIKTTKFTVIESPLTIVASKPVVLEQRVESDGTKTVTSNTVEQVKTVDSKIEKFVQVLSKQIPVQPSQITNVVSRQSTNTNEYTITVKTEKTTNEIKAVFKKDDETVIVTDVTQQPKQFVAPIVKPKVTISKEEYTTQTVQKVVQQINRNPKIPNITTEKIVDIVVTKTPVTSSYEVTTETVKGKQTFVVTQNPKGEVTVIDYKPAKKPQPKPVEQPSKTEYTVNPISGFQTQVTNDVKVIKQSRPIQSLITKVTEEKQLPQDVEVISAVTKTSDTKVQTTIVMRSPEKPEENIVFVGFVDKQTGEVEVVAEKTVQVTEEEDVTTVQEEVITTVYTTTVIQRVIKEDKTLQKIVNKVQQTHRDVVQQTIPTEVTMEKVGEKVISTVTYEGKHVSTVVYDESTDQVQEISSQVPQEVKPLVYQTERTPQGETIITTNSVQKVTEINQNFDKVISEIKQSIPSIQTENIEGIRITRSDVPDAPQKIVVVFQTEKPNEKAQIAIIDQPTKQKPVIIDVQTIMQEQLIPKPEPVKPVKLSQEQIKEQQVEPILIKNIKQLPVESIKKIIEVSEVKTAYTKVLETKIQDNKGDRYIVKTEQIRDSEPTVIDYVKVTDVKKPQIFTVTTTNNKNGIVQTYTNDVKVMSDEKTFSKCVDALEKQRSLTKNGFTVDSETVSRFQRSVEHHIRFVNKDTSQGVDYRVIVDSRTGQVSINEEEKFPLSSTQSSTMPSEKSYLEIPKSQLPEAMKKYSFIQSSLDVLRKADYTYDGKIPDLTQVKQYKSIASGSTTGVNAVEVIMTFPVTIGGAQRKARVVFLGEQKTGKGYIMKIIDITTLPQVIASTETKISIDEYNRKVTSTNDVKTLEKTNQQFTKVVNQLKYEIPSLSSSQVSSVVIREMKNANDYTMMVKKGTEVIETRVSYNKVTNEATISDFKTQSTKSQVEKVPIREIQSIVTQVPKDKLTSTEFTTLRKEIITQQNLPEDLQITSVKIEQNPKVDSYVVRVIHTSTIEGTVTAIKNPVDEKFTIISYKPDQPLRQEPVRTKDSSTETTVDSVTGTQVVTTDDVKVIKQTPIIQSVVKKIIEDKTVSKSTEVVSAVTKTSQNKIQTTFVVQQPSRPKEQKIFVAIADKNDLTKVEIVSSQTIDRVEQTETTSVEEVVITQVVYKTVIKKNTHLQKIVKAVETKYTDVQNVTPVRVTMQQVGGNTISEITYDTKKVTVISNDRQEVVKTYDEPIPKQIVPGKVETTITKEGVKTVTSTSPVIMEKVEPTFKTVLPEITKIIEQSTIQTVISQQTTFGKVFTVVSQKPEEQEPQQTTYYVSKETQQVVNMGTEQIPVTNTVQQAPVVQPVRQVPETKWTTQQVQPVIQEVTRVVKQEKVLKVEELKPAPTVRFYEVTVETQKGPEVIKVTVDRSTKEVQVINQKQQVVFAPQEPKQPQLQAPSETKVTVDQVTGVKTTVTTDQQVIKNDEVTTKVHQTIVKQNPELKNTEIVSTTKKQYEQTVEERIVLKSQKTTTEVVTLVDKKTQEVKIVDKAPVDSTQVKSTTNEVKLTQTTLQQVYNTDDILRRATEFVEGKFPRFKSVKPTNVNVEQLTPRVIKFTFVYEISTKPSRVVVIYTRSTNRFELVQQPSDIEQVKSTVFETTKNDQGRTTIFTNDIETITQQDKSFTNMLTNLRKQIQISSEDVTSVQSTQTSTGSTYTIITQKGTEQNQVNVIYNDQTNTVKITDLETLKPTLAEPTPRTETIVPKEEYTSDEITFVISESINKYNVPSFTISSVQKIVRTTTTFGRNYVFDITTQSGTAYLTSSITTTSSETSPSSQTVRPAQPSSTVRKVTVISYRAPAPQPTSSTPVEAPSKTQFTVDTVTGTKIESTNDVKVIKESKVVQNVVDHLVKSQTIPRTSEVVSTVTKSSVDNVQTTMVVKTSSTQSKVIVTVTDKKTNNVQVVAEKPVPVQQVQQPDISKLVPQTVITSTIYQEVVKKDTVLQNVVKQVTQNHPEITETKPTKVVVDKVGEKTVTEVSYQNVTFTVVSDVKTGKTEQVTSSPLPKPAERKPVVLQQTVTEEGTKIVTSNNIETIEKVVPEVRPAITEVVKVLPTIKTEQIKTISTSVEQKQYTIVTVDKSNNVKQVKFTYEPEKPKPIRLIDVQEFSEPVVLTKPKEIVYEPVKVEEKPEIVKAIEIVNRTNSVVKNDVTEIVKVEKAVTNFVEQYKVQVKTSTQDEATIVFEVSPTTKEPVVVDVIRFEPKEQQPEPVVVQQTIDPVTQTRQTVFPTVQTYKDDETYTKVTEYLQTEITKGYEIASVIKQNYGENKQISVLLKSEDKSPQQVQLNINSFNNEVTVLQNKTIVHETEQTTVLTREQPKQVELKLSPVDQEKFEILTKLQNVKQDQEFKTVTEVKQLEKNVLFKQADEYLKTQYETVLQQSNVVHVTTKQTLDSEEYKVYYVNTEKNDKEVYEATIKINPVTQSYEVEDFSKVGLTTPEKSKMNIDADIAYGYEPLENFSNDKNVLFVVEQTKKHYPALANAVIQSVQVLSLCNQRFNYKIFFKNGLEVVKYILYFEEAFQRVIFLAGKQFSFGGGNFETLSKDQLVAEGYFKNLNQNIKENNNNIAEGSQIVFVEREDKGLIYNYRVIYSKEGKTYHAEGEVNKDTMAMQVTHFTQIIEVPVQQQQQATQSGLSSSLADSYATLKINDLALNSNFEKVHREILSKEGSFLQNAQLVGAQQKSEMFKIWYRFYFLIKQDYYKIEAEIDSTTKKVTILTDLEKVNTESGFAVETNSADSQQIISWAQKNNPDLKSGVIVEVSSKKQIFGKITKIIFKLQAKYNIIVVYKEGEDLKVLSQLQTTSIESGPTVRSLPRPNSQQVQLNKF